MTGSVADYQQVFINEFLGLLAARNGGLSADLRSLISQLIIATQAQNSCLLLTDEVSDALDDQPVVGSPGEHKPLIRCENRLYLHRYFQYETGVADRVIRRNRALPVPPDLKERLDREFGTEPGNQQKLAGMLAMIRNLLIITGGPGTGKTSTVRRILTLLLEDTPDLEIKLAAPTGKAAMRLEAAIHETHPTLPVQTLHRLLGIRQDGRSWRHHAENPVSADLLIVDEASMIDLPMMYRLLDATRDDTRLILLGDPYQLPSVDTGNVLADLCRESPASSDPVAALAEQLLGIPVDTATEPHGLTDAVVALTHSYRFDASSDIGRLAAALRAGDGEFPGSSDHSVERMAPLDDVELARELSGFWQGYLGRAMSLVTRESTDRADANELLVAFDRQRVLCSRNGGPGGATAINTLIESQLVDMGLRLPGAVFYPGRPVLITRNDYNLGLFNGDIGVTVPMPGEEDDGQYLVVFPGDESRTFLASRLPEHQTCFAMTVHKSQGSEFDNVMLLLSEEASEEALSLLTRELLYTAVTRARQSLKILSPEDRWRNAISRSAARMSGMSGFLKRF